MLTSLKTSICCFKNGILPSIHCIIWQKYQLICFKHVYFVFGTSNSCNNKIGRTLHSQQTDAITQIQFARDYGESNVLKHIYQIIIRFLMSITVIYYGIIKDIFIYFKFVCRTNQLMTGHGRIMHRIEEKKQCLKQRTNHAISNT